MQEREHRYTLILFCPQTLEEKYVFFPNLSVFCFRGQTIFSSHHGMANLMTDNLILL